MSQSMPPDERLARLSDRFCSETITPDEIAELEQLLSNDIAAEQYFLNHCHLHSQLFQRHAADSAIQSGLDVSFVQAQATSLWRRSFDLVNSNIAASLAVSGLFFAILLLSMALIVPDWKQIVSGNAPAMSSVEFVARITDTLSADWDKSSDGHRNVDLLEGERLVLKSGLAEVRFDSGATLMLEGPATLTCVGDFEAELSAGKLLARVPREAYGFTITTPNAEVVDLGTEFGVEVDARTYVAVNEGAVEVTAFSSTSARAARRLVAGEALSIGSDGTVTQLEARRSFVKVIVGTTPIDSQSYAAHVLSLRPYAYWSFDEVQGGGVPCLTRAMHGTLQGGPAVNQPSVASRLKTAISFDGEDDQIILDGADGLSQLATDFTVAAWIRPADTDDVQRILSIDGVNGCGWGFGIRENALSVTTWSQKDYVSSVIPVAGEWVHVAVSLRGDQADATFYVNGEAVGQGPGAGPAAIGEGSWSVGSAGGREHFHGDLDEMIVFDRILTESELASLVHQAKGE